MADASMKDLLVKRAKDFAESVVNEDDKRIRVCIENEKPEVSDDGRVRYRIPLDKFWSEQQAGMDWDKRAKALARKNKGVYYRAETYEEDVDDAEEPFTLCLVVMTDMK